MIELGPLGTAGLFLQTIGVKAKRVVAVVEQYLGGQRRDELVTNVPHAGIARTLLRMQCHQLPFR